MYCYSTGFINIEKNGNEIDTKTEEKIMKFMKESENDRFKFTGCQIIYNEKSEYRRDIIGRLKDIITFLTNLNLDVYGTILLLNDSLTNIIRIKVKGTSIKSNYMTIGEKIDI